MIDKEEFVVLESGEKRWLLTSKLPLRSEEGEVIGLVGISRDITLRRKAEEQVRFLAYRDPLTGLANRSRFESSLDELAAALPPDREARLILIDLDRFKQVNDTLGHGGGDDLLRAVANRLVAGNGHQGEVSRLGGDEFAIVVLLDELEDETSFYDQLTERLRAPYSIMGNLVHVGASVGVSRIHRATTPFVALREADIALYEAKSNGRNRWQLFEGYMADRLERRHQLENDLREALLAGEQFLVEYQPVYGIREGTIVGAEALVRWQHPEFGLIGPDQFITIAEERGLIVELGELVVRKACEMLKRTSLPWVVVNVSPLQLRDRNFAERLISTIRSAGVRPVRLQVEITEGMLLDELGEARAIADRLRWAGVRIAIDDFGTGYSSLAYLARLAVDKIKIDRSFVAQIGSASADAIVQAVLAFAKALSVKVTAEGVETEEQRRFLELAGCDELQGFLLSKPISEAALAALLAPR